MAILLREFENLGRCADFVLLNKVDMLKEGDLEGLSQIAASLNPLAKVPCYLTAFTPVRTAALHTDEESTDLLEMLHSAEAPAGLYCLDTQVYPCSRQDVLYDADYWDIQGCAFHIVHR